MVKFLETDSSFAFEMQVRELFAAKRLRYRHGGTYDDPIERKPRQFDLTADLNLADAYLPVRLRMAIECKCLSEFAPMLVYRSPRSAYEAGHCVIARTCGDRNAVHDAIQYQQPMPRLSNESGAFPKACTLELQPSRSMYSSGEPVGKSAECITKDRNGNIKGGDKEIYPRWTQALQSASAMLPDIVNGYSDEKSIVIHWIVPILVVPDDRLYVVDFNDSGAQTRAPTSVDRTSFFVDYTPSGISIAGPEFRFGHLEIMTYSHLKSFVDRATHEDKRFFVEDHLSEHECFSQLSRL